MTTETRPLCKLTGQNGNVFNIISRVRRALINAGMPEQAKEFVDAAERAERYEDVLRLAFRYVDVE